MFIGKKEPEYETTGYPIMHVDQNINVTPGVRIVVASPEWS
jgi:hypothetical protein